MLNVQKKDAKSARGESLRFLFRLLSWWRGKRNDNRRRIRKLEGGISWGCLGKPRCRSRRRHPGVLLKLQRTSRGVRREGGSWRNSAKCVPGVTVCLSVCLEDPDQPLLLYCSTENTQCDCKFVHTHEHGIVIYLFISFFCIRGAVVKDPWKKKNEIKFHTQQFAHKQRLIKRT